MTVQELFNSLTFDEVVSALMNAQRNDKSIQYITGYKEAFDTLSNIEFIGEGGNVTFDVTEKEHLFDEHNLLLLARNVEGDLWENIVGKLVIKPEYNPFTDAELAGAILWGSTFMDSTGITDGVHIKKDTQNMEIWCMLWNENNIYLIYEIKKPSID